MSTKNDRSNTARKGLLRDTEGLTTVEYIIILCLIAVAGFGAWNTFGKAVSEKTGGVTQTIGGLPTSPSGGSPATSGSSASSMIDGLAGRAQAEATDRAIAAGEGIFRSAL